MVDDSHNHTFSSDLLTKKFIKNVCKLTRKTSSGNGWQNTPRLGLHGISVGIHAGHQSRIFLCYSLSRDVNRRTVYGSLLSGLYKTIQHNAF